MSYKIFLSKLVFNGMDEACSDFVTAWREAELPFVPSVGLELLCGKGGDKIHVKIKSVLWVEERLNFTCYCENDFCEANHVFQDKIKLSAEEGWNVSKVLKWEPYD